ncbi:MAG: DHH family phosphoesterase [Candidatus Dojkabacteria bacterium]
MNKENKKTSDETLKKIKSAEKILIVPDGKRVDHDCISSAVALKLFLIKLGKAEPMICIFGSVPNYMKEFVTENEIVTNHIADVDFNSYDLIFLLDAPQWDRVLSDDYQTVLDKVPMEKFINIDHHEYATIYQTNPETVVVEIGEPSTTKVLYDLIIEPSGIELDKNIAEMLYVGLVSDSQFFRFGIKEDTLSFGQILLNTGIDHYKILNMLTRVEKGSIDYLTSVLNHIRYYPEIKLMTLIISEKLISELDGKLGDDWMDKEYFHYFNDNVAAKITGFDYCVTFKVSSKGTKISWRSANYNTIALKDVLEKMNFFGGGHRNAGGGVISDSTPEETEAEFVAELTKTLSN